MSPFATLQELVETLPRRGSHAAVLTVTTAGTSSVTYAELGDRALRLAAGLSAAGIRPGDPVVLIGPNSVDWIIVRLGLAAAGAVAVAIDDVATDAEIAVLVPDSGARHVFAASAHIPRLRAFAADRTRRLYRLDDVGTDHEVPHWTSLLAAEPGPLPRLNPNAPAMLVFTSGTTGNPKSFFLSDANLIANIRALADEGLVGSSDRALLPLPLHHVYPLTVGCLTALASGTTIVLPAAVTGPELVRALRLGRCTVIVGVPRLYAALFAGVEARVAARGAPAHKLFRAMLAVSIWTSRRFGINIGRRLFAAIHRQIGPELRLLASGGAKFEAELIWQLKGLGWEVLSGYGLAETASILTANRHDRTRIGSEGQPLAGVEIRINRPDEAGIGEIETRGPSVFAGYRNDAAANEAAFTDDGWFRTGDLGRMDADGYVYIAGRVKEMIVLGGGKNVFPEEIEKIYAASPYIREIAVLEHRGALVALVVPDIDAIAASGNLRVEDVIRVTLSERARELAPFQRVAGFAITRVPLPRTRLGKYQRFLLPDLYTRAKSGVDARDPAPLTAADRTLLAQSPAREIWAWLQARYPDKALAPDMSPQLDLGIDSLEWVTVTLELAERFGVQLTEADATGIVTLRDLIERAVERRRTQPPAGAPMHAAQGLIDDRWISPPGPALDLIGRALHAGSAAFVRSFFRLRVDGAEHIPAAGPYVIACNHLSDLDPLVVAAALGRRRLGSIWWSGDAGRLFKRQPGRLFARALRIFPVDERAPATTLAYGEAVLRRGNALVWFPESWRSPDGELQTFLPGIGHLLARTGAAVIPTRIAGTFEAMPRNARLPRPVPVRIVFGPPLSPGELAVRGHGASEPMRIVSALHAAVAALPRDSGTPAT
ncbi:MAG TPA: AMP-binding protein [Alphaproteobacteria bacterium]